MPTDVANIEEIFTAILGNVTATVSGLWGLIKGSALSLYHMDFGYFFDLNQEEISTDVNSKPIRRRYPALS